MSTQPDRQEPYTPIQLHERAMRDVAIIRGTMERSTVFTAVSGPGTIAMGLVALFGAPIAALRHSPFWWVNTWAMIGAIGFGVGIGGMIFKAWRTQVALFKGAGRRFIVAFAPAIIAGYLLSEYFLDEGRTDMLPPMWMLLYGVSVTTSGAYSVQLVPIMGLAFMAMGTLSAFGVVTLERIYIAHMSGADLMLAGSFGALHILFGAVIWWRHGNHGN